MARYAQVQLKIWTDDKFPFLGDDLQLVFFHLLTTPAQTPLGLICVSAESLAAEKRWNADRYKKRLREGEDAGLWAYDARHYVVYFRNYWKHNKPGNPDILKGWLKCVDDLPCSPLVNQCLEDLRCNCVIWGEIYLQAYEQVMAKSTPVPTPVPPPVPTPVPPPVQTPARHINTNTNTNTNTSIGTSKEVPSARENPSTSPPDFVPLQKIQAMYNAKCTRLRKIKAIVGNRQTAVAARYKSNGIDAFEKLFDAANASDFLCGNNERNWSADFDWLMNATNMAKVLEGKYDNRASPKARAPTPKQRPLTWAQRQLAEIAAEEAAENAQKQAVN